MEERGLDLFGSRSQRGPGSCKHGNDVVASIKCEILLE
jgi:hypothetical protein